MLAALALFVQAGLAPSGSLFLVGGGTTPPDVVDAFLKACGGKDARIIVLPLGSAEPDAASQDFLKEHGATNTVLFAKAAPTDDDRAELKREFDRAKGIWMPGGVQERFVERLGKPWCDANLKPLLKRGVNFYGTSAGAMVCSETMILGPGKEPGTAATGPGFGLTRWIVDTHFKQRAREGRLRDALRRTGLKKGVGIDERDWIVVRDDRIVERHGAPTVIESLIALSAPGIVEATRYTKDTSEPAERTSFAPASKRPPSSSVQTGASALRKKGNENDVHLRTAPGFPHRRGAFDASRS